MATDQTLITAQQLLEMPGDLRCELINGEVVEMSPVNRLHGIVAAKITLQLGIYLSQHDLGTVAAGDVGYVISRDPDTVRCPDVCYVQHNPSLEPASSGFYPGPPDLAIEIISPNDRQSEVDEKIAMWLHAGTVCVWTVDPQREIAAIHQLDDGQMVSLNVEQLSCESLLPGLVIEVAEIF